MHTGSRIFAGISFSAKKYLSRMKNILIADNHSIVRLGIRILVQEVLEDCHTEFADNNEDILLLLKVSTYDLLIMNVNMTKEDNASTVSKLLEVQPSLKILAISADPEIVFAERYLKAGAYGYVQKSSSDELIRNAIRTVSCGRRYYSPELMHQLSENYMGRGTANPFDKLSSRELEVGMLLLRGMGLNEVAHALGLHNSTASTHKARLFEKLGVENVVGLISIAATHRITAERMMK